MKILLSFCFLFFTACATPKALPRVKPNYFVKFKDGTVQKSTIENGKRIDKAASAEEWANLRGYLALPVEDYEKLIRRQNL